MSELSCKRFFDQDKVIQKVKIYTFWQGNMPPYISMCLETFKKSGYEFVVLNHSNINEYIPESDLPLEVLAKFPPAAQGDILAAYMMNRSEGYFVDADTIFFERINHLEELLDFHDVVMVGDEAIPFCHAAFVLSNGNSPILQEWEAKIRKLLGAVTDHRENVGEELVEVRSNSFGHPLLHPVVQRLTDKVKILDKDLFLPESRLLTEVSVEARQQAYRDFYFTPVVREIAPVPFLILHNSWTPDWYQAYSIERVMQDELFISKLLRKAIQ